MTEDFIAILHMNFIWGVITINFLEFSSRAFPQSKRAIDPWLSNVYRPFSLRISWRIHQLRILPNTVTFAQIGLSMLGCLLIALDESIWYFASGIILLHFAYVLDCVDGEVARVTNQVSLSGMFLDKFAHSITMPAIFLSVAYRFSTIIPEWGGAIVILAWFASFASFNPVSRLVLTVVDALIRKDDLEQYNINTYLLNRDEEAIRKNKKSNVTESLGRADRSKGLVKLATQIFRHVTYIWGLVVLLVCELIGLNYKLEVVLFMLGCGALALKEVIMFQIVMKTDLLFDRYYEFSKLNKSNKS